MENARQRILNAAEARLLASGPAGLVLDAVAADAGISKGGLLYHFGSKEALVAGLCERMLERFDRELEALCGDDVHLGAAVSQFSPLLAARAARLGLEGYRDAHHRDEGLAETVRLAVEHGYPEQAVWVRWQQVQLAHALGAEDDTPARTRQAIALAEEQGINNQIMARSMQGFALALEGKREEQLAAMRELLQLLAQLRHQFRVRRGELRFNDDRTGGAPAAALRNNAADLFRPVCFA